MGGVVVEGLLMEGEGVMVLEGGFALGGRERARARRRRVRGLSRLRDCLVLERLPLEGDVEC